MKLQIPVVVWFLYIDEMFLEYNMIMKQMSVIVKKYESAQYLLNFHSGKKTWKHRGNRQTSLQRLKTVPNPQKRVTVAVWCRYTVVTVLAIKPPMCNTIVS